jgi:hypothetical protein
MTLQERFEAKYIPEPNTGCWLWTAATKEHGYGVIGLGTREQGTIKAHRLSYILHKGEIPQDLIIMHSCNTPSCVNPDHLQAGTLKDNQRYMVQCGRLKLPNNNGENAKFSKIKEVDAKEIIAAKHGKVKGTGTALARKFGVHKSTIYQIWAGKNWKMLKQQS